MMEKLAVPLDSSGARFWGAYIAGLWEKDIASVYSRCIIFLDNGSRSPCATVDRSANNVCPHGDLHSNWAHTIPDWDCVVGFSLHSWDVVEELYVNVLLLQPRLNHEDEYVRIGLVYGVPRPWYDEHASPATVTITQIPWRLDGSENYENVLAIKPDHFSIPIYLQAFNARADLYRCASGSSVTFCDSFTSATSPVGSSGKPSSSAGRDSRCFR
jgi:hypothetical protein